MVLLGSFELTTLQAIYDRASLLSTISTSLARMKTAESPSLRYKAVTFAARVVGENCDHGDRVIRGIEKGAWDVLLSTVRIPIRSHRVRREVERATSNTRRQPDPMLCDPNIVSPGIQVQRKGCASKTQMPIDERSQVEDFETTEALFQQFQQDSPTFSDSHQCSMTDMKTINPVLMLGSHGGYLDSGASLTLDGPGPEMKPMRELNHSTTPDSISPYCKMNHEILSLNVQPLTTFDEWLYSGESTIGYTDTGDSWETMTWPGYDEDVSFY